MTEKQTSPRSILPCAIALYWAHGAVAQTSSAQWHLPEPGEPACLNIQTMLYGPCPTRAVGGSFSLGNSTPWRMPDRRSRVITEPPSASESKARR